MLLEKLAKKSFEQYSKRNNYKSNWTFLSKERKVVWMEEVLEQYEIIVNDIKGKLKPTPPTTKVGMSGLEKGYIEGVKIERMKLIDWTNSFINNLKEELNEFKIREEKRKNSRTKI